MKAKKAGISTAESPLKGIFFRGYLKNRTFSFIDLARKRVFWVYTPVLTPRAYAPRAESDIAESSRQGPGSSMALQLPWCVPLHRDIRLPPLRGLQFSGAAPDLFPLEC